MCFIKEILIRHQSAIGGGAHQMQFSAESLKLYIFNGLYSECLFQGFSFTG